MSLLSWFSSKKSGDAPLSALPSSGMSRMESTKPHHQARHGLGGNAQPGNRKQERMERRELLYARWCARRWCAPACCPPATSSRCCRSTRAAASSW
ncbi:hypothetical protein [Ramlibacter montanisoli]|uniref:hypothetical protein n=1 Tax=Ramlibacter montanisoli TaxID=2732512 RepID=UPI00209BFC79|nr:hypothetical protein [Ramlibacter montanisoli]